MQTTTIVLATRNKGKIAELSSLLAPFNLQVLGLDSFPHVEEVEETGTTFVENALLKACAVSKATGCIAIADDSGIEVDYLNKAPGVYSARYSATPTEPATDERNLDKLLKMLRGVPAKERTGRFQCCMAACAPDGATLVAEGAWEGVVLEGRRGENGFGYDPVFFDQECGCTAAEMSRSEKNQRSHRAKAVAGLLDQWPAFWEAWLARQ